jgi:hypothetical protein
MVARAKKLKSNVSLNPPAHTNFTSLLLFEYNLIVWFRGDIFSSMHSTSFNDLFLKPELLRAIVDCGFEHPSEGI